MRTKEERTRKRERAREKSRICGRALSQRVSSMMTATGLVAEREREREGYGKYRKDLEDTSELEGHARKKKT